MRKYLLLPFVALMILLAAACTTVEAPTATPADETPNGDATATPLSTGGALITGLPDIASVAEQVSSAVVQIVATVEERNIFGQSTESRSQGSGFFFDEDGYILTNNHVVEDAIEVEVALSSRSTIPAEVVGTDPETDLAVLKVDPRDVDDMVILPLGDTDAMRIGEWVIAIGSPLGFQGSVTVGVVSAKGRTLALDNDTQLHDLVQTDAVINPGNSGGPLLNLAGEVIGINTAIIRGQLGSGQEAEGIGFSISMGTAGPVSEQLIENGRVIRPRIGVRISDVTPSLASERGLTVEQGVLIVSVAPGGPADRAGLEVDDVIVQVDDRIVSSTTELVRLFLTAYSIGDVVTISAVRSAVTLTFEMELEEVPDA